MSYGNSRAQYRRMARLTRHCDECGREIRPCNWRRHMDAHYPQNVARRAESQALRDCRDLGAYEAAEPEDASWQPRACVGCAQVVGWLVPTGRGSAEYVLHPRAGGQIGGPGFAYWCAACRERAVV
jgi:hypothetical protein